MTAISFLNQLCLFCVRQMPGCKPIIERDYQFDYTGNRHEVKLDIGDRHMFGTSS